MRTNSLYVFGFASVPHLQKHRLEPCANLHKVAFAIASHTICVERRSFRDCWVIYDCFTSRSLVTRFQARPHRINFLMELPASLATIRPENHWPEYLHDSYVKIAGIQSLARLFFHRFAYATMLHFHDRFIVSKSWKPVN
jgi:hypothetical protein